MLIPTGGAAITYLLTRGWRGPFGWFEDAVLVDVWLYVLVFLCRKVGWFRLNLREKDEIVRFFKTTCWEAMALAPTAELLSLEKRRETWASC